MALTQLIGALAILLAALGMASPSTAASTAEFMAKCRSEGGKEQCEAFLTGFMTGHIFSAAYYEREELYCTVGHPLSEIMGAIEDYLNKHPEALAQDMIGVMFDALAEKFPCGN